MFELHASMPPMQSAECQATISQKFPIIIVVTSLDGIYGWSIQTWLREENDSKQSDKNSENQQILMFLGNQRVFKRWIHTLIYYTRCNHLKYTPLFPCVMFHYCLLQVPVVQKMDNALYIQREHYPMDSAISFPNKYLFTQSSEQRNQPFKQPEVVVQYMSYNDGRQVCVYMLTNNNYQDVLIVSCE